MTIRDTLQILHRTHAVLGVSSLFTLAEIEPPSRKGRWWQSHFRHVDQPLAVACDPSPAVHLIQWRRIEIDEAVRLAHAMRSTALATPFQNAEWLQSIVAAQNQDKAEQTVFVAGYEGARAVILLPLTVTKYRGLRALGWLGQSISDYNGPLAEPQLLANLSPADTRRIWFGAAELAGGVDLVYARKQPLRIAGLPNPFAQLSAHNESDQAHIRRLTKSWSALEGELTSHKGRRRLREKQRALEKRGHLELRALSDPSEIELCAASLMKWKADQLDRSGATNPFADPSYCRFFTQAASLGASELHAAFLDAAPIAATCLLKAPGWWTLYQTGFDPAYSRYSIGRILNLALIERAVAAGADVFDFGYGDEEYKQSLCDQSVPLTFTLLPFNARGAASAFLIRNGLKLRGFAKKNALVRSGALWMTRKLRPASERTPA